MRKFLFDVSFDESDEKPSRDATPAAEPATEAAVEEAPPPPPPEPTFSEAELIAERTKSYDEGRRAGSEEAWAQFRTQTDQIAVKALKVIGDQLQGLFAQQTASAQQAQRDSLALAVAITGKMLPELASRHGLAEIETVVKDCVAKLVGEPKVAVRVHPSLAESVAQRLEPILEDVGFEGKLQLQPDEKLGMSDVRIDWAGGGLMRDATKLWQEVETAIAASLGIQPGQAGGAPGDGTS